MSNNSNHNHSSCGFAEQMMSYLYGEGQSSEFETHLKNCSACAAEIDGFGFVRSSVLEWRTEEFSNLETPAIEIPQTKISLANVPTESHSWLDGLRKFFAPNAVWATAALAVLVACAGLVLLAFNYSKNAEVAKNDKGNSVSTVASPTIERTNAAKENSNANPEKTLSDDSSKPMVTAPKDLQPDTASGKTNAPKNVVVKVPNTPEDNKIVSAPAVNISNKNKNNKTSPNVKKSQAPTLTNGEDDEDKSVRLADLFDEIDAR